MSLFLVAIYFRISFFVDILTQRHNLCRFVENSCNLKILEAIALGEAEVIEPSSSKERCDSIVI